MLLWSVLIRATVHFSSTIPVVTSVIWSRLLRISRSSSSVASVVKVISLDESSVFSSFEEEKKWNTIGEGDQLIERPLIDDEERYENIDLVSGSRSDLLGDD